MLTIVAGWDRSPWIPPKSIKLDLGIGDHAGKLDFELWDDGCQIPLAYGMPIALHDENVPGTANSVQIHGAIVTTPVPPADNLLANGIFYPTPAANWSIGGALSGIITITSQTATWTFHNAALGLAEIWQTTNYGYIFPGQQYMLSAYIQSSVNPVNVSAFLQLTFYDAGLTPLGGGGGSLSLTPPPSSNPRSTRVNCSAIAPAGAAYAIATLGGQTSVAGANAGTFTWNTVQLEPMYFASSPDAALTFGQQAGITALYPTQDINYLQQTSLLLPDGTTTRYTRIFSGYINDLSVDYDGPNRIWKVSCASPTATIDSGGVNGNAAQINATYTNQTDAFIIADLTNTYFPGLLSASGGQDAFAPASVVALAIIETITYSDTTLRDVLNGLIDLSGGSYSIGPDYRIYYNPLYYNVAWFSLTDQWADGITTFNYHDYEWHLDGTQVKKVVKVTGGQFIAPQIIDQFSGGGGAATFTLTYSPYEVSLVTVGGTNKKGGIAGVNTFSQGYDYLINKAARQITFASAPASGTNNILVPYTYEAPVSVTVIDQFSGIQQPAPAYVLPAAVSQVSDTAITDLATATTRGLAELTKNGEPKLTITFSIPLWIPPGFSVLFTSTPDGIISRPFVVWTVTGTYLGNGVNEYQYTCGNYVNPSFVDHVRHHNRALSKSTSTANITAAQQFDIVFNEPIYWGDASPTLTAIPPAPANYGSGSVWGTTTYS